MSQATKSVSTVIEVIRRVFPRGTRWDPANGKLPPDYDIPPVSPFDLFAVTALLLNRSGAYQRIIPDGEHSDAPTGSFVVSDKDLKEIQSVAAQWANKALTPPLVTSLWKKLVAEGAKPVFLGPAGKGTRSAEPNWWNVAYRLMAIADEASQDVGYEPTAGKSNWLIELALKLLIGTYPTTGGDRVLSRHRPSITSAAVDQDVVCVQPKARTPDVGCSLRNLSHNLSLLPPRGVMRVHWITPPCPQERDDKASLNLLLIPFPYKMEPGWFDVQQIKNGKWNWFKLGQKWLMHPKIVVDLVDALLHQAKSIDFVHGIVFPEYALNWAIHKQVAELLRDKHPSVQFFVSGGSTNCQGENGNFALASHFFGDEEQRIMASVSRPKHHRWSLENGQISAYNLDEAFPDKREDDERWWEKIPLQPREIHINAMRSASVFTVMICEDLARSDPAHEPLRSIGPNLVFVLLMDGPQLSWRWAARYSMGLADDPGSSVLTLTSRGLVDRWNSGKSASEKNWSIGLWKDEGNRPVEIDCPPDSEAVLLKLRGVRQSEMTLDGRHNTETFAWTSLKPVQPVSLDRANHAALLRELKLV